MSQLTKTGKSSDEQGTDEMEDIKSKFGTIQQTPLTRTVTLKYKSCCGCGCDYYSVERIVPYNSSLKNGDKIDSLEKGDKKTRD